MSIEALWTIRFTSTSPNTADRGNWGTGVMILETGRIFGGDGNFTYVGHYKFDVKSDQIDAEICVSQHGEGNYSIFGSASKFDLHLTGKVDGDQIQFDGYVSQQPSLQIRIDGIKRENLP